jgi:uncharacterized membrane protein YkoI
MNRKTFSGLLIATGVLGVALSSFAGGVRHADASAGEVAPQARLTMAQAVTIAEARLDGRVVKAELASEGPAPIFKLRVATAGNEMQRVRIAALGGEVLTEPQDAVKRQTR